VSPGHPGQKEKARTLFRGTKRRTPMSDMSKEYTENDFNVMGLRAGAIKDFTELLDCADTGNLPLTSIALIIRTLIEPVDKFLSWCATYAEIPGKKPAE
jgi:hypothetical protein